MSKKEILEKLKSIFKDFFADESLVITEETTANDIDDWDSLANISLIALIQSEFSISCSLKEVVSIQSVKDMIETINSKINKNND